MIIKIILEKKNPTWADQSQQVEATTLREAILWAIKKCWTKIVFEGDTKLIIDQVNDVSKDCLFAIVNILNECKTLRVSLIT